MSSYIEEYNRINEKDKITMVAIHHPNHFNGKWTLLATCKRTERRMLFTNIVSSYPHAVNTFSDWGIVIILSHPGIVIEDLHDFLLPDNVAQQLLENGEITMETMAQIISRRIIPFDSSKITLDFGWETFERALEIEESGPSNPPTPMECKCHL